jgi:hypothetical protein
MLRRIIGKPLGGMVVASALGLCAVSAQAQTNFEKDVGTAIDRGIEWLANQGAFNNPSTAGQASGLPMLALLEKRASGDPTDPPQGYDGASATDQARLRNAAAYILDRGNETSFYAYADGNWMFGLSEYALTGGPDKSVLADGNPDYETIKQTMDRLVDRALAAQRKAPAYPNPINQGYWCYTNAGCEDSSTTQFVTAGLAAAKTFYSSAESGDQAFADPARVAAIDAALALARQAYELNARQGSDYGTVAGSNCALMTATERGHGYRTNYPPSLQQTASGIYIQQFGGANLNTPMVQNYMEWVRNRYRWQNINTLGNSWSSSSYWYYLWSSFKALELMRNSGIAPNPGNLGADSFGTLPSGGAPACSVRQDNKDPATFARVPSFGAGGAGFYDDEPKGQYFDYAHQILTHQCYDGSAPIGGSDGLFACNGAPSRWDNYAAQSYALLVLQRATGGACVDSDGDGVCDSEDNCPGTPNPGQEDRDGDGVGDVCDNCPDVPNPGQEDENGNGIGDACEVAKCDLDSDGDIDSLDIRAITKLRGKKVPPAPAAADYDNNKYINVNDARGCTLICTRPSCATR